jgi:hypothetical protein
MPDIDFSLGINGDPSVIRMGLSDASFAPTDLDGLEFWLRADLGVTYPAVTITEDISAWATINALTVTSGHSDPLGGTAAYKVIEGSGAPQQHFALDTPATLADGEVTFSLYMKQGERRYARLFCAGGSCCASYDLLLGVVSDETGGAVGSMTDAGNGWWLCTIVYTGASWVMISTCDNGPMSYSYVGDDVSGHYVYGPEISQARLSAWADQSGTGDVNKNATQATIGNQPAHDAADAAYGNQPTVTFDGANSMVTGTWAVAPPVTNTVFIVGQSTIDGSVDGYLWDSAGAGFYCLRTTDDDITWQAASNSVTLNNQAVGSPGVIVASNDGGNGRLAFNSKSWGAGPTAAMGSSTATGFVIGAYVGGGVHQLTGKIAEIIIYDTALSDADRGRVLDYLSARYGITVAP